jgi:hypothetical protein
MVKGLIKTRERVGGLYLKQKVQHCVGLLFKKNLIRSKTKKTKTG